MVAGLTLSLLIGLALGLFGGGGSILAVPILTYLMSVPVKAAIASSLLIVGATSAAALIAQWRSGNVVWRTGLTFGLAAMFGAYAGGHLARFVPEAVLLIAFGLLMFVSAVAMLRGPRAWRAPQSQNEMPRARMAGYGLAAGLVAGLLGAGGGFLIVPALVLLSGMPMRKAVGTSLLVIFLQSAAGFLGHVGHSAIPWHTVLPVVVLAILGSIAGGALSNRVRPDSLRRGFAWLSLLVAVFVIARPLQELDSNGTLYTAVFVTRWPWWVGGIAIAAVALGLLFVENRQLGVSTGCGEVCLLPVSAAARASWRPRFLLGIVLGGAVAAVLARRTPSWSMGGLDELVTGTAPKLALLFVAGILIGTGARLAGGCTSGHAIIGTALGARSSWLAAALFLIAAFATTRLLLLVSGGGL
ncbi:MAG: TSUP family transporter [Myxococcota bacterium]